MRMLHVREGHWILLDEINLAAPEVLQRLCGLLQVNDHHPFPSLFIRPYLIRGWVGCDVLNQLL